MTPTRIVRFVGITGLIGWFGMVGWVAKSTQAQNGGALPLPVAPAGIDRKDGPPPIVSEPSALQPQAKTPTPPVQAKAATPDSPVGGVKLRELAPPPVARDEPPPPSAPAETAAKDPLPPISPAEDAAAPSPEDPEKSAQAFVERNQKEAEAHLKALTAEAAQLRARLARLESGIKRWQTLVNALRSTQGVAPTEDSSASALEPLPKAAIGDPRADKRVKWASSTPATPPEDQLDQPAPDPTPARAPAPAPYARPATAVAPGLVPR
jgi:hypothetical protein